MTFQTEPPPVQGSARQPLSPVAARLLARARKEWAQRQFDAAERSITSVLALAPDDADAPRMLGVALQHRGDQAGAIDCFRQVLSTWPEDAELRVGLGIALYEQGEIDEAMTHLRHACELAPASSSAWFNLGEALWRQTHTEEAVTALQRALELDPSHIPAQLSLARTQTSLGQIDAAVTGFRHVLRLDPGNPEAGSGCRTSTPSASTPQMRHASARPGARGFVRPPPRTARLHPGEGTGRPGRSCASLRVFRLANASRRRRVRWDAAGERRRVDAIQRIFARTTCQRRWIPGSAMKPS